MPTADGFRERSGAVAIRRLGIGASLQQQRHCFSIVPMSSPVQRGGPVGLSGIDRRVLLQQAPQRGNIAILNCIGDFGTRSEARLGRPTS